MWILEHPVGSATCYAGPHAWPAPYTLTGIGRGQRVGIAGVAGDGGGRVQSSQRLTAFLCET